MFADLKFFEASGNEWKSDFMSGSGVKQKQNMFKRGLRPKIICCLAWALLSLSCAIAYAQQEPRQREPQRTGAEAAARVPSRPSDIISDNLEKAAATADQILEVLSKEVGLTVEFKRLLARDAERAGRSWKKPMLRISQSPTVALRLTCSVYSLRTCCSGMASHASIESPNRAKC